MSSPHKTIAAILAAALTLTALSLTHAAAPTSNYWAYQPIAKPAIPSIPAASTPLNPVDAFILTRLQSANIEPAPEADRRTLIRRATYDLTGLPPTPQQIDDFVNDPDPAAYTKLIERLLASPQYGVKWARHWLDLVHFAETNGYERDNPKPNAWRYRDYVINAFNSDKPYDQFITEQLAGDIIKNPTPDSLTATGYYRLGLWDDEPVDKIQAFYDGLDDVVATTSNTFLAMSVGCARCHDHKKDPIPQTDYYRLMAFFANTLSEVTPPNETGARAYTQNTTTLIASQDELTKHEALKQQLASQIESTRNTIQPLEQKIEATLSNPEREDAKDENTRRILLNQKAPAALDESQLDTYRSALEQLDRLTNSQLPPLPQALTIKENGPTAPETHVHLRGSAHAPGDLVTPGFPVALGFPDPQITPADPSAQSTNRRLALANWLTDPANPLTARVMVNRIFQHHFSRGIVATPNDFGTLGESPTHPLLLDFLASYFIEHDWSIKQMHRLLMNSAAYKRASADIPASLTADPTNQLFWRFNPRRLTAEEIRDSVLAVNGSLNPQLTGPSIYTPMPAEVLATSSRPHDVWGSSPPDQQNRRSIFIFTKRSLPEPFLKTFDLPDTETSCPRRFSTTVPTQTLATLNSEFMFTQAKRFAQHITQQAGPDPAAQIKLTLQLVTQRTPTQSETQQALAFLNQLQSEENLTPESALQQFCLLTLNLNEFIFID